MLSNFRKSISISGASVIETADESGTRTEQVAYMSASIDESGRVNINKNITNQELYAANKTAVRADFTEFEAKVYEIEDENGGNDNEV